MISDEGKSSASYDAANELKTWNGTALSYDADGNMLSDGSNSFTWNARNQVAGLNGASVQYDAFGRRSTNAAGTSFLYDGANAAQELSGSTITANLASGGLDEVLSRTDASGTFAPLKDALGSAIALADSTGTIQTLYTYDPFGGTSVSGATNGNKFQYTGRENDGNGLYYYRARYYSPAIGRFISEDPIGFAGGINVYAYVGNSPTNWTDPFGLRPGDKYPSDRCAGWHAENDYDSVSRRRNLEYGGFTYQNPDGTYSYTDPSANNNAGIGTQDSIPHFWDITIPAGTTRAGWYHTHAAFDPTLNGQGNPAPGAPGYNWHHDGNEVFSPDDKDISDMINVPGYLGTPQGTVEEYSPSLAIRVIQM